ncbi:MAG: tetratricopeptide repeat protein, partial [Proteobacteria bacterium]|nr:tetratricopeptide repeat protein [Pseudomonadota bacterium]
MKKSEESCLYHHNMDLNLLFQNAVNHQNQGNLDEAAQYYYAVIQQDNKHFAALVNLGSLLKQKGNTQDAMKCFQQALSINQNSPELWFNYANLLQADKKIVEALKAFHQAIQIKPDFFAAHYNLANLLRDEKELEQAEIHYKKAVKLKPDFVRGFTNLGNVLRRLEKHDEAIATHRKAKKLNSKDADIHYNLGRAMVAAKRYDEAMLELKNAMSLRQDFIDAQLEIANLHVITEAVDKAESIYNELIDKHPESAGAYIGKTKLIYQSTDYQTAFDYISQISDNHTNQAELAELAAEFAIQCKQYQQAIAYCKKAIKLKPNQVKHYNMLGLALLQSGQNDSARKIWQQSIEFDSKNEVDARVYLGQLAHKEKRHDEALAYLRLAVSLGPDRISPSINLGFVLLKLGVVNEAVKLADDLIKKFPDSADVFVLKGFAHVQNASMDVASSALEKAISLHKENGKNPGKALMPSVYSDSLFSSLYNDKLSAKQIKTLHQQRCDELTKKITPNVLKIANDIHKRPIRVAYLSSDLKSHPVAFFLEPVLANHKPENCEIFCYSLSSASDEMTKRLKQHCANWRECAYLSDEEIIALMRQDNIDILIDLAGHTAQNRLAILAKRAAPIQAVYLGYPSTTGLKQMDFIIADKYLIPEKLNKHYSEKPMLIKGHSFLCYQPQPDTPEVALAPCVENGYITFGSFNNLPKISPSTIKLWSKILKALPDSRLALKALAFTDEETRRLFWHRFEQQGVKQSRIDLLPPTQPLSAFLDEYRLMDIALDSIPYNGGTTTCDALWMGVPVLTLSGD